MKIKFLLCLLCLFAFALSSFAQTNEPRKIEELTEFDCEALKIRTFNLVTEIEKTPYSMGYLIVYEGNDEIDVFDKGGNKSTKQILPRFGELNYRIKAIRAMVKFMNGSFEKIKIINGGFRKNFAVDFWFVPKGAEQPKPTPTLKKMKYRKGNPPKKFSYWDC
jgi:hypothetical protein